MKSLARRLFPEHPLAHPHLWPLGLRLSKTLDPGSHGSCVMHSPGIPWAMGSLWPVLELQHLFFGSPKGLLPDAEGMLTISHSMLESWDRQQENDKARH
jgi:hypothetical protein